MKKDIYLVKKQYFETVQEYEKLGKNMTEAIKLILEEQKISYLAVEYRIKSFDSFLKKIERKKYLDPFTQMEDICGVRIICYYRSDIEKICKIINDEFLILESEDKEELLEDDRFGYRSHHFIVMVREAWLATPNYKGLGELKAELQVRTNLMHTWAEIEHKLEYKKDDDIPLKFKRKFSRIAAKLEEADEQFEELRMEINDYRQEMLKNVMQTNLFSGEDEKVNMDTLQVFMDFYFPGLEKSARATSELVYEMNQLGLSMMDMKGFYDKKGSILEKVESEVQLAYEGNYRWSQASNVASLLELCSDEYVAKFGIRKGLEDIIEKLK